MGVDPIVARIAKDNAIRRISDRPSSGPCQSFMNHLATLSASFTVEDRGQKPLDQRDSLVPVEFGRFLGAFPDHRRISSMLSSGRQR